MSGRREDVQAAFATGENAMEENRELRPEAAETAITGETGTEENQPAETKAEDGRPGGGRKATFMVMIRALAGIYLIYTGWSLFSQMKESGDLRWYYVLAAVLFAGFGFVFAVISIRQYLALQEQQKKEQAEKAEKEQEAAPPAPAPRDMTGSSIRERLRRMNEEEGLLDEEEQEKESV